MLLKEYFDSVNGTGILATADGEGAVNTAIYSKPHVTDDGRVAFLMRERLTWHNIEENPQASFMFIEAGGRFGGIRMRLQEIGEEVDDTLVEQMTRSWISREEDIALGPKHLVWFRIEQVLSLVGDREPDLTWH